jgi:hypothetical protein
MLVISYKFLDMASTYAKYHEYRFFVNQILLFHVPTVQIWNILKYSAKQNKLMKYIKKVKILPNFKIDF